MKKGSDFGVNLRISPTRGMHGYEPRATMNKR